MRRRIVLKPRRQPKQDRSRQMREDILTASIRVLRREGALRFTTPRVAEAAGISVGSLYQYFPNKESLIFAIHSRTVELAWIEIQRILGQGGWSARAKVRRVANLFFLAESEEVAEMGPALQDAEIFFADQPEHHAMNEVALHRFTRFVREELPGKSTSHVVFGAQFLVTVIESVGRTVAGLRLPKRTVRRWARACADMVADHLGLA
jgi:AcrR family transcriptional regulator